jgi:superfamily II DNA or RNA helicase
VYLTEEETSEYSRISGELAAILAKNGGVLDDDDDDFTRFMQLIRVRNALLGSCDSKTSSFQNQADIRKDLDYQLVFCSEGKGLDQDEKQLAEVVKILGRDLELGARKYVSETTPSERIKILKEFSEKALKFVVSMRCLDEGVDLPDARVAYLLASSTDPRQWVQRRGRILRLPRDGNVKQAEIIDFVTLPDTSSTLNESVKALVLSEVKRVMEFGEDSVNSAEAGAFAENLMREFNLESHD